MESQIENAITIAFDPRSNQDLQIQAIAYINEIRTNPSPAWQSCLNLFAKTPAPEDVVRHVSLEVVNNAIERQSLDKDSLNLIRSTLMEYVRRKFAPGSAASALDPAPMQNKITQTFTYLFLSLYAADWGIFFDEFRALSGDHSTAATVNNAGAILYLRVLGSVHDEIADPLVARTAEELKRNTELKDLIRQRDMQKIAQSWQDILGRWTEIELSTVEMCLKVVSRWVSWIDINLVVNQAMLASLFSIAGQQTLDDAQNRLRNAAIDTFAEIVGKKMKPADKLELITFLNLSEVVGQLIASPALSELKDTPQYDTDLAETVAKLVNTTMMDLVKILDTDSIDGETRQRTDQLTGTFVTYLLRFFADEYDEICSNVIPSLTEILTYFRKLTKMQGKLPSHYSPMVQPALDAIVMKMKYDETASWGEEDEQTDEAEFQELRKRLYVLQQTVAAVDEELYINTLSQVVANTFGRLQGSDGSLTWRDLDLALHEMYLFGELAVKNVGIYAKREPSSTAAGRLIEMMLNMVTSEIASYPHPAIQLQYMEICVRYFQFFEHNTQYIPKALENFVRLLHSNHVRVKGRSWYLFVRFVRPLRLHVAPYAKMVVQAIGDLLTIRAELPEESSEDMSSDEEDQSADALFNSQLYLFEAIGCIASSNNVSIDDKVLFAESVINPLLQDIQQNLAPAKSSEERAVLQIHHNIMALGTLARGFADWTGANGPPPDSGVTNQFVQASEAILVALESLNSSENVRAASRFCFSRLIGVLGRRVLEQLPRWINGLLSQNSTQDEMALFLRVLDQIVFAFKSEISGILDGLLTPLLQRVFAALSEPVTGTDDQIQLAELRREYLSFILIILNHGLEDVLVSATNQATFELIISTSELFARDNNDYSNAQRSVQVLVKMLAVWGGPDVPNQATQSAPTLAGFDNFALTRFSPLCWSVPSTPGFNTKDALARQVLHEIANLQRELLKKCGSTYLERLKEELRGFGISDQGIQEYLTNLTQSEEKSFRNFFAKFLVSNSGG